MSEHDAMREAVRADILRSYGPAGEEAAADTGYAAARAEADAIEAGYAERARLRQLELLMDLREAYPLPAGMYFDIADDEE